MKKSAISPWELSAIIFAVVILVSPFLYLQRDHQLTVSANEEEAEFAGSLSCQECHQEIYDKWLTSDHKRAMDVANDDTVLGNFNNINFIDPHSGVTSRFFRDGEKYMVETEGETGTIKKFEVSHVFGFYPLQQYLIPFPDGKLQCFNVAWDVQKKRWYRLPPYEVEDASDWLHWTQRGQTWNVMCAECHSTELKKNYDIETDSYTTSWAEISVGCEACHGPSSNHITWAKAPPLARSSNRNYGLEVNTATISSKEQVNLCAPCHSRRFQLGDNKHNTTDLLDKIVPSVLSDGLYHVDGQILEEVYVWGSFTQSKMYQSDVRCSDCHDPHSGKRKLEKNQLCTQCHRKEVYDDFSHHFHKQEADGQPVEGFLCVKCHMPGQYYMGIDYRHDHSLRIPRPDLSRQLGTPNSCSTQDCHGDKELNWVVDNYTKWYGQKKKPHYGELFAKARLGRLETSQELVNTAKDGLLPIIVRATALSLLRNSTEKEVLEAFVLAMNDNSSLMRYTALRNFPPQPTEQTVKLVSPMLYDSVKAVRIEAAALLANIPLDHLQEDDRRAFEKCLEEYKDVMIYNGDLAGQRTNFANLLAAEGNIEESKIHYQKALQIDGKFYPAKVNFALLLNGIGENEKAITLLEEVVEDNPELFQVRYSLGLILAEEKRFDEAVRSLRAATEGLPSNSRIRYNYGLALINIGKIPAGFEALYQAIRLEPSSEEYFAALANMLLQQRMYSQAYGLATEVLQYAPNHKGAQEVVERLQKR